MLEQLMRRTVFGALAVVLAVGLGGCADSEASAGGAGAPAGAGEQPAEPRTVVAVVDFSGSQTSHAVGDARTYLEKVVEGLGFGDRFVLMEMYRTGPRDSVGTFVRDMPEPIQPGSVTSYDQRQLEAAKRGVLNALPVFFDPEVVRTVPTTDILATMHIAAEHLRDAGDREKQLLVLSDMLQSTPRFEFQGARRMPSEDWVEQRAQQGLLPSLSGTCVVAIGADHTTPAGQQVREFWADYFSAAGASLDAGRYRLRAPTDVLRC